MNIYYIYRHLRKDTNEVFYIGKGKLNRAWSKKNRNPHWHHIVNSVGYNVEIIKQNLFEEASYKLEIELIDKYKKEGLCKANYAKGGLGGDTMSGKKRPDFAKKISGKSNGMFGKDGWSNYNEDEKRVAHASISKTMGSKPFKAFKDNEFKREYINKCCCERETGVKRAIIRKILDGKQKTTRDGWSFYYIN